MAPFVAPASHEAQQIAALSGWLFGGGTVLFLLTMALLAMALWRGRPQVAPAVWIFGLGLALPVAVLGALIAGAAASSRALSGPVPADALNIGVTGHAWWWELHYETPQGRVSTANELRLPAGRTVRLALSSRDVIHSFWVPSLGGKMDLVPGRINRLTITAPQPGVYRGPCAEFCGQQHARMALTVVVMPADEFERWLAAQAAPAAAPLGEAARRGETLFAAKGCVACHEGGLGPDLRHVAGRLELGAGVLANEGAASLRRWLSEVQALKPGARMPSYAHLDAASLDALAAYLAERR